MMAEKETFDKAKELGIIKENQDGTWSITHDLSIFLRNFDMMIVGPGINLEENRPTKRRATVDAFKELLCLWKPKLSDEDKDFSARLLVAMVEITEEKENGQLEQI